MRKYTLMEVKITQKCPDLLIINWRGHSNDSKTKCIGSQRASCGFNLLKQHQEEHDCKNLFLLFWMFLIVSSSFVRGQSFLAPFKERKFLRLSVVYKPRAETRQSKRSEAVIIFHWQDRNYQRITQFCRLVHAWGRVQNTVPKLVIGYDPPVPDDHLSNYN